MEAVVPLAFAEAPVAMLEFPPAVAFVPMAMALLPLTVVEVPIATPLRASTVLPVPNTDEPSELPTPATLLLEPTTWMLSPLPATFGPLIVLCRRTRSCCCR